MAGNAPIDGSAHNDNNNNNNNNNNHNNQTSNHCSAPADDNSSHSSTTAEAETGAVTDSDSISTMSNTAEDSCLISLETLKCRMEAIKPGITTTDSKPTHTDAVLFQEAMGNAVAGPAVFNQSFGFAHLVDTTKRFQK